MTIAHRVDDSAIFCALFHFNEKFCPQNIRKRRSAERK